MMKVGVAENLATLLTRLRKARVANFADLGLPPNISQRTPPEHVPHLLRLIGTPTLVPEFLSRDME